MTKSNNKKAKSTDPTPKVQAKSKAKQTRGVATNILHHDLEYGTAHGGIHFGIDPSVTFGYKDVNDLVAVFQNRQSGYAYSRNSSPTTGALESKVTVLEGGRSSLVYATGLAAISSLFIALLKEGDHIIVSRYLFGNTYSFFNTLVRLGFDVSFVDTCNSKKVLEALQPNTKFFFTETIANPGTQIPDLTGIAHVLAAHKKKGGRKIISVIDNTITTPYLFKPKKMGFAFSVNSLTKFIAGQGSVLAGSLTDLGEWKGLGDENILPSYQNLKPEDCQMVQVRKKGMRDLGATLSPFGAHLVALGMETLTLRMDKHLENAQAVATYLEKHPKVAKVHYPGLKAHPQHAWAKKWFKGYGAILSFVLQEPRRRKNSNIKNTGGFSKNDPAYQFMNALKIIIRSSHLGDSRTLAIPVAKTIFNEMGPTGRAQMGIAEQQIRLSVGLEDQRDLLNDLEQALAVVKL